MIAWKLPETFVFDGRTVRYGVRGAGPPVVLVHGTPWSSFNLRHLIEALSVEFTVYYHDLLGYGQSDKAPGDVSLGIQNRVLAALLDHWRLERPAVIGHDFGGATLLRTHLLDGRDFDRIVLIDPVAISPWGSPFFRHVREHEAAFAGVPDYIHEAIVRAYVRTAAFLPIDEVTLDGIVAPWMQGEGKAAFYRQIARADAAYTDEVQARYPQISRRGSCRSGFWPGTPACGSHRPGCRHPPSRGAVRATPSAARSCSSCRSGGRRTVSCLFTSIRLTASGSCAGRPGRSRVPCGVRFRGSRCARTARCSRA